MASKTEPSMATIGLDRIRTRLTTALDAIATNGEGTEHNLGYLMSAVEAAIELTQVWGDQ